MKPRLVCYFSLLLLASACEKARLDDEVDRLCKKDGGIAVHETVVLPFERFDRFGEVRIVERKLAKPTDEFFYVWDRKELSGGSPSLHRDHFKVIQRSDGKVLGEGVAYTRRGGDVPGPWHDSFYGCPKGVSEKALAMKIFVRAPQKKAVQ